MLAVQPSMGVVRSTSRDRETLFPERKQNLLQEFVGCIDRGHSRQSNLLD